MRSKKSPLEINNLTGFDVGGDFLLEIFNETFIWIDKECIAEKELNVSLAIVSEEEIKKLNSQYRGRNEITDVLSFAEYAKIQELCDNGKKEIFLGEIILCPEYISHSAKEQGVSFNYEMAYIFSHGILHLLGFEHGKEMFDLQERVAKKY